jgi:hypothetical protein
MSCWHMMHATTLPSEPALSTLSGGFLGLTGLLFV